MLFTMVVTSKTAFSNKQGEKSVHNNYKAIYYEQLK